MLTKNQISQIKEHLNKAQNPLFFFHNDPDGLCSFLLLQRYIGRGKGIPVKTSPELTVEYFRKVNELNPDYIFILDQPEVSKEFFAEVNKINLPIVWIDHHEINKKKIPKYINYYNPVFNRKKTNEPVTYLCYQISKKKEDLWIGVIGSISDKFFPDFYSEFQKNFPDLALDSKDAFEIYYNSEIGEIAKIMNFGLKGRTTNVINMLKFLVLTKSPYDVLEKNSKNYLMHKRSNELYDIYKKLMEKAENQAKNSGKIFFFKYGGNISMSADISNRLKYLFPEKIIVVMRVSGSKINISIRGRKIRDKILNVIKELKDATGGGHEDAVGAGIRVEDLEKFKEKLMELV